MRVTRGAARCSTLALLALALGAGHASANGSSAADGTGALPLGSSLVIPGAPGESEQVRLQEQATLASPEAAAQRVASLTAFENLDAEQAEKIAGEAFPEVINDPAGGPPQLPAGQTITGYLSDDAAEVDLGGGKHAVIESTAPVAVESSSGQRVPVNLGPIEAAGGFRPATPVVGLQIPKRLGEGVRLPGLGVSLTPVDGRSNSPLGGSQGAIVGTTVLYANTQTDTDSLIKPTTAGFEADTLLRSVESPQQLYFRVGLPEGASLVQAKDGSGVVEVDEEGAVVATILPPGAQDAVGTAVPVSMSVSGDTLALNVADHSGEYQYPIEVDPEVLGTDPQLVAESNEHGTKRSNWEFYTNNGKNEPSTNFASNSSCEHWGGASLETCGAHEYKEGEAASWVYQTRGVSKIYEFTGATEAENTEDHILSTIELWHESTKEAEEILSDEAKSAEYPVKYSETPLKPPLCPTESGGSCGSQYGHPGNAIHFQQSVVNKPTSKHSFSDAIDSGKVYISEPEKTHSTTSYNTSTPEFEFKVKNSKKEEETLHRKNALDGSSNWLSEYDGAIQFFAKDTGIGVSKSWLEYEKSGKWEVVSASEHNYLTENLCKGVQCPEKQEEYWMLNPHLPNGEDKIRYRAEEAFGQETHQTESLETEGMGTVKVDTSKPHSIYLGGLPFGNELSEKVYKITAYATDGEGATIPSSGIVSLAMFMENSKGEKKEITKTGGSGECSAPKGECTASAEYTINGSELGAGHHGIVIVAKDGAGNEGREEEQVSVRHSTPVPMGPGSVDLESGDFALGPTDVSLGSGLSVSRVYSSRDLTAGVEGGSLLGPQWSLSLGSEESLIELVDKSVLVTGGNGSQTVFAAVFNSKGEPTGKFEAPPGDSNLTMTLEENEKTKEKLYNLKDPAAGTSTKFTQSSTAKVWVPTEQTGPVSTDAVSYIYETVEAGGKKVTRPSEVRGATPAKVSCAPKMVVGCRALKFTYATKTKSGIGEGPTEWGEYEGRLVKVFYEGYNPATKKMTETPIPVVEYAYDKQGRLRAEWDPRLAPHELKTTYGYDEEGHVTALTPPGQESWVLTYGTIPGDTGTGRLLKATQAPASASLWKGEVVKNTEEPKISGTPLINDSNMSVSTGTWSGAPVVYGYQWEDCNTSGTECVPIPGATNSKYTLVGSDVGHTLVARVTATNGDGSVIVASLPSGEVKTAEEYALGSNKDPQEITVGPEGDLWFTEYNETTGESNVSKMTTSGTVTTYNLPEKETEESRDELAEPFGITAGPSKEKAMWVAEQYASDIYWLGGIGRVSTSGELKQYRPEPNQRRPYSIVAGPDGKLWFTLREVGKIDDITTTGEGLAIHEVNGENAEMGGITVGPDGNLWYTANWGPSPSLHVGKITTAGVKTEYAVPGGEGKAGGLVSGPEGGLWFAGGSIIGKVTTSGAITEYHLPSTMKAATWITAGPEGDLWFTGSLTSEGIGKMTPSGVASIYPLNSGRAVGIVAGPEERIWFANKTGHKIGKMVKYVAPSEPHPEPGITIDYNVPVAGAGAPHNMSEREVAKWGQKAEEAPVEATAIFPPDSPQDWPASSYVRGTIYYLDGQGRLVNTATPSSGTYGSISTTEYNEYDDVVRTLSPDNRATSLEAGETKSAEVASLLSTVSVYNEQGQCRKETAEPEKEVAEPGTRLCETWGPEHKIKDVETKPSEVLARNHTKYYYEDSANGAPAGENYDLVTETQDLAQWFSNEGKSEGEVESRRSATSYEGQDGQEKNLGWKLREPTLVTEATESGGAKVKHTTLYNENGQVTETRGPEGSGGNSAHDARIVYYGQEENKEYTECGAHPEWAGLVCETLPAKRPETTGVPNLPETKTNYNIWNEPETIVETFPKSGSFAEHTRTTKDEYDAAGRLKYSGETSTATTGTTDKALPKITEEYNEKTGVLEKQCANEGKPCSEGKPKTITSSYNTLGQLESYADADGNVAKFKYAGPEKDGLLEEMSDSSDGGESNQKYTYNTTTEQLEKLVDSAAGTFTASYDAEGNLVSEVYPNGMCANHTDNSVGEATHVEYTKTSTCSEKEGVWFSETKVPSVRGETMSRTSTLASEEYGYDTLGRLTEVHETPVGEYCKTRIYEYDEESNRKKLITRGPNSKNECATIGGTEEEHKYDEASRLTDSGIEYDALGNVTKLPAIDAEGHALESTFYVDNAVATQTQNGVTNDYYVDPIGRVRETITGAKKVINHYDGSGEAVAWSCEGSEKAETCESGGKWTRNIPGIDGTLTATENGTGPVTETPILQLHDLQGDVVAMIKDKTGETKLESTYNSTEFGVPNGGKEPPKFAWLGASDVEKSLASGVVTEGATSYVPQTGMALQSEEVAPPGLPEGSGGQAATFVASPWNMQAIGQVGSEAPGREAGWEHEAWEHACLQTPTPGCPNYVAPPGGAPASPAPPPTVPESPPSINPGAFQGGCQSGAACAAGVKIFGPNSCHLPYTTCHVDFTRAITVDIVKDVFPHEAEESGTIALVCAIPAIASAEAAGVLGFGCAAVLAYYWGSFIDVVNHIHEWGGCVSIRYQLIPAPWVTGIAPDGGSGCV